MILTYAENFDGGYDNTVPTKCVTIEQGQAVFNEF